MSMNTSAQIHRPTIAEVLDVFLADQHSRLSDATYGKYETIVNLLQSYLNNYAYNCLHNADSALFEKLYNAKGKAHREFCEIFGPDHIPKEIGQFLDYFMVRKVIAGKETLRAAGTVTKKIGKWLAANGYISKDDAANMIEDGSEAATNLPKTNELAEMLDDFAENCGWLEYESNNEAETEDSEGLEGYFSISRVEPRKIWLKEQLSGTAVGPIVVPENISSIAKRGWTISGVANRAGEEWHLVEVWNVYP